MVAATSPARLLWPSATLLATMLLHDLDHVRQGRAIESAVIGIGILGDLIGVAAVVLAAIRHPFAPAASVVVGFGVALGFVAVHIVPDWGPLSQGYPGTSVDAVSWVAALIPILAGVWLGLAGLREMRVRTAVG
jgi:hypothetical protein